MAWEPLVGTRTAVPREVAILFRRLRRAWQGEEWPGARGSTGLRTAVLGMPLRASQGGKWGRFHACWRPCGGEAGTRKALAGRGGGSTGRYRRGLFQLVGYPTGNKGTVRLPIPPTSVLAALRGSPVKFGFWISEFRGSLVRGGAGKRSPRLGRRREPNSNFEVNSLSLAAQDCLGFCALCRA